MPFRPSELDERREAFLAHHRQVRLAKYLEDIDKNLFGQTEFPCTHRVSMAWYEEIVRDAVLHSIAEVYRALDWDVELSGSCLIFQPKTILGCPK